MGGTERSCAWMSGPKEVSADVTAAQWWFAISRDVFAKAQRSQQPAHRRISSCHLTPTFSSPLARR